MRVLVDDRFPVGDHPVDDRPGSHLDVGEEDRIVDRCPFGNTAAGEENAPDDFAADDAPRGDPRVGGAG